MSANNLGFGVISLSLMLSILIKDKKNDVCE